MDETQDLYTAELAPGALIYFAPDGLTAPQPSSGLSASSSCPLCACDP